MTHRLPPYRLGFAGLLAGLLLLVGCAGTRTVEPPPDERFGHRYEDEGPAGRRTITLTPPDAGASFFTYPVVIDSVHIRHGDLDAERPAESQEVAVEVVVKGAFPDGCYTLHDLEQERLGHFINVTLTMRKPEGAMCTMALRPYRFYFTLDGLYTPGAYRLAINGDPYPFVIQAPPQDNS